MAEQRSKRPRARTPAADPADAGADAEAAAEPATAHPPACPVAFCPVGLAMTLTDQVRPEVVELDGLLHGIRGRAAGLDHAARRSVGGDAEAMARFLREDLERGSNRGVAMFSSSGAGLWEAVWSSRPFRDRAVIAPHPDLLQ